MRSLRDRIELELDLWFVQLTKEQLDKIFDGYEYPATLWNKELSIDTKISMYDEDNSRTLD